MKRNRLVYLVVPFLGLVFAATSASAGSILPKKGKGIDFSSQSPGHGAHTGGTLNFTNGFGNALTISDAPIFQMLAPPGSHGPVTSGKYAVTDGEMNIVTGGCISGCTHVNGNGSQGANFSGVGSSLKITGEITRLGIDSPETLIEGYFSSLGSTAPAIHVNFKPGAGGMNGYLDITYINPLIVSLLHLTHAAGEGQLTQVYLDTAFLASSKTWSGVVNASNLFVVPTPEPANLVLLGTVLLVAAWITQKLRA